MQLPVPGDLVSIDKPTSAILVGGNLGKDKTWGYALITVEAEHTGLILETYNPKGVKKPGVTRATDELLKAQQKRISSNQELPEEVTIMVMTIGTTIVEIVYDPGYMTILSL